jgi:hypothetical protein
MQNKKKNEKSKHNIQRRTGCHNKSHRDYKEIEQKKGNLIGQIDGHRRERRHKKPKTRILRKMYPLVWVTKASQEMNWQT